MSNEQVPAVEPQGTQQAPSEPSASAPESTAPAQMSSGQASGGGDSRGEVERDIDYLFGGDSTSSDGQEEDESSEDVGTREELETTSPAAGEQEGGEGTEAVDSTGAGTQAPQDELTLLRQQNQSLMNELNRIIEKQKSQSEQDTGKYQDMVSNAKAVQFLSQEEHDQVFENPEVLNNALNKVFVSSVSRTIESLVKVMPKIVNKQIANQLVMYDGMKKFYEQNAQMVGKEQYVNNLLEELTSESPNLPPTEIFVKLQEKLDKSLGKVSQPKPVQKPDFVARTPARAGSPVKQDDKVKDIDFLFGGKLGYLK